MMSSRDVGFEESRLENVSEEALRDSLSTRGLGLIRRPEFGAVVGCFLVYVFLLLTTRGSGFMTVEGTASVLNATAELGIIAVPVALLMIGGEFDFSVGAMLGASSLIVAVASGRYGVPLGWCVVLALGAGLVVGFLNGLITVRTKLPSFIVTLAMSLCLAGASLGISRLLAGVSSAAFSPSGSVHSFFAGRPYGQFNASIIWWLSIALIAGIVLTKLTVGNWIMATGGDPDASRAAGVPTSYVKTMLFMATAFSAALVGVIQAMEFNSGDATRGQSFVFNTIIAAVIGGVLLQGGYGSIIGVVAGTLTYGLVSVGIFYTGWNPDWTQLILGLLMLGAVLANNFFRRLATYSR